MNKPQAAQLIKNTFTRPFDRGRFRTFALNLVNRMDESKAFSRNIQYIKDAFKPHVSRFERLGTYTSPDKETVDVLIVHLTQASKLERARTAIRNFVADHLKDRDEKDAALVAFVSPAEAQWRFSYVKMEYATVKKESGKVGVETRLTPARRFSYLVGEGESCHTAQTRFLGLLQDTDTDPTLAQMEEAFSVEAVTKEFFGKYAERFDDIHAALDKMVAKDKTLRNEFKEKNVSTVDFAKKLLGQVVFLYFLQKKGWLGVEKGKDWGTGPRDFLRRMARGEYGKYNNFFNDILEPLFYDTLATDRGHEAWCARFKCRIPFLNGGLFEPLNDYDWKKTDILIPNKLFTNDEFVEEGITGTGVLDVFDRYNFTVNEAEPLEKEVAIDPEMLGKVFENLIEENRRKGLGAFYTPREIVHYMCQESLMNYLEAAVNAVPRADVETFVRLGEQISHYAAVDAKYAIKMPKSIEKNAKALDEALKSITVCDPAVGSGAFPVGMMTEIVRARAALTPYFNDVAERTPYHFKRHAIQNCLYGVDIDASAVEIAKLRLWLSLIVDEEDVKQVKPLPNLDYKIVIGNSLLGVEKNLFNDAQFKRLEILKPQFFNETDRQTKARLKAQIEALIHELTNGRETFDFEIFFSEVFHAKGGFDVVIANPPYVSVEKFARTAQQKEWKRRFKTFAARGDIYCFFYERGLGLLRDDGVLTFISSNKFQRAGYGKGLRQLLASQRIRALVDFCELPVFAAATDPMIVVVNKGAPAKNHEIPVVVIKDETEFETLHQSLATRGNLYKPEQLKADGWSLEGADGLALVDKLRAKGTPLGQYVNGRFYRGILTGLNEAFVIDRVTRDRLIREDRKSAELIKPWIRGVDIRRWRYTWNNLFVFKIESSENASHQWSGQPERAALLTFKEVYPAVAKYLCNFEQKLRKRTDQGTYFWELRSCVYWDAFTHPKIVFNETSKRLHAYLDTEKNIINKTGFIILSPDAAYVLSVLNSTPMDWLYRSTFPSWGDPWNSGRVQFRGNLMAKIPIPAASSADKARLTKLAERAAKQAEAENAAGLRATEREIDEIVYRLFDLTPDEVGHIEKSLAGVRAGGAGDDEEDSDA
jgi:type I restriction-modification system DNA methylase subunit